jgi:hypothetical protein
MAKITPPERPIFAPGSDERDEAVLKTFYIDMPATLLFRLCDLMSLQTGIERNVMRVALLKVCDELQDELRGKHGV